jgi:putative transposase
MGSDPNFRLRPAATVLQAGGMPRALRASLAGLPHHVIARANGGARLFDRAADFIAFLDLIGEAGARAPAAALGYCLMPNHVHLLLRPAEPGALSRWMQWLLTTHSARRHRARGTRGHVWQGRFKAFPIQDDRHFLTVLRYVERNALRAGLVQRAEDWRWSSLAARESGAPPAWLEAPDLPGGWRAYVNEAQSAAELDALRRSVNRGWPFGEAGWASVSRASGPPRSSTRAKAIGAQAWAISAKRAVSPIVAP